MNFLRHYKKIIFTCCISLLLVSVQNVTATSFSDVVKFNVDKNFDATSRDQITSTLVKTTSNFYFYVENQWWDSQLPAKQNEILASLDNLSSEFSKNIYPTLTSVFGKEWNPGVDGDSKITVLFQAMNSSEGGYFRTADEYIKLQIPSSNEREMLYLSLDQIDGNKLKTLLAHEFVHLITFNQKNKNFDIEEETWLNEARADYASTILGYDSTYAGSNLQSRVKDFVSNPSDSVTEWRGTKYDYSSISLFTHYLVDHYGINILTDSLKSEYIGIESINYALVRNKSKDGFSQIFTNWTIASIINNCSTNSKYCYLDENLKSLRISPALNFIPINGNVSLSVTDVTKNWTGNWLKFIGGSGDLKLDFSSLAGLNFEVPYILENSNGNQSVQFLTLDDSEKGEISVENFGADYKYIIIIPSLQSKFSGFDGVELTYPFTYSVSAEGSAQTQEQITIQQLLNQIALLKAEIAKLLSQKSGNTQAIDTSCYKIESNLYLGMKNNEDVKCLQKLLASQGSDIYPEGYVTGNFGNLTQSAVIKFQEKYSSEILTPVGLSEGTGYVGSLTRQKINVLLASEN